MIKLQNGITFDFMAASGSLGFCGNSWPLPFYWPLRWQLRKKIDSFVIVSKTITLDPINGQMKAIYDNQNFVVNAVSLHNPGIKKWGEKYLPKVRDDRGIILSITERSTLCVKNLAFEITRIIKENDKDKKIIALEFNVSCSNAKRIWLPHDIAKSCYQIKQRIDLPLGLKIGYQQEYLDIIKKTRDLIEWVSLNSVPWEIVFPGKTSPLWQKFNVSGAVSGKIIQPFNKKIALDIKEAGYKVPIIASSVGWKNNFRDGYNEVRQAFCWAEAVSFGSLFRKHPAWPIKIINCYNSEKEKIITAATQSWWLRKS